MFYLYLFLLWLFVSWLIGRFILSGSDHSQFDRTTGEIFSDHPDDAKKIAEFLVKIKATREEAFANLSLKKGLQLARHFADNLSAEFDSDCEFRAIDANGISCEWTIAPNANPNRRILFFHGGAYILGSAKGHRIYTHHLSHLANAAVLSVNYRMLPEHGRHLANKDAQTAYRWILENGPSGATPLEQLLVSGDSAGGNLALMISAWSKTQPFDHPDGVICFSPNTDLTANSPTIKSNIATDPILGEGLGLISKLPRFIIGWLGLFSMRVNPANPVNSPLFGDLSNLPPTLIQASDNEMLLGESLRYTNKALAAGSSVKLQIWKNQIHDWQIFTHDSGSAKEAYEQVKQFVESLELNESKLAKAS